ncbi:MAG: hypothetical protein ABI633_08010 [Burkholderiales bacterium]
MSDKSSLAAESGVVQTAGGARFSVSVTVFRALIAWLLILALAIVNGALREGVLIPKLGTAAGLMLSGLMLSACVAAVAVALMAWLGRVSTRQCLGIGAFWLALTLGFEFGFGRSVRHKSWPELLDAYTFKDGNLWLLVLVVVFFAPLLAAHLWTRRRA